MLIKDIQEHVKEQNQEQKIHVEWFSYKESISHERFSNENKTLEIK